MCSIGHHDGPEAVTRSPRRHTDGSVTRQIEKTPRAELLERRALKTAQLRAEIEAAEADALADAYGANEQLELIPVGADEVPHAVAFRGLPDPNTLWYSAAREP